MARGKGILPPLSCKEANVNVKYIIFNGNEVWGHQDGAPIAGYRSKGSALRAVRHAVGHAYIDALTIGEVTDDGCILRMWSAFGTPLRFESHGGDHGAWV